MCSLMLDEMIIGEKMYQIGRKFSGYIDFEADINNYS